VLPPKDAMLLLPVVQGKRIVISIAEQKMWTYEAGGLRSEHVISTGIARSPTLPGLFQVLSHHENAYASRWDLWMPNFLGIYDALPGFTNGIHGLPLLSSGVRLWGNVLGRPASFGCIILDLKAAEELYAWAEDGVVVEIRP
jgi:lipoprotein-anchoring transpeptidase ErfK/SrfK